MGGDESGTVINPMIVEGQIHGGLTEGFAIAFMQEIAYDESGWSLQLRNNIPRSGSHHRNTHQRLPESPDGQDAHHIPLVFRRPGIRAAGWKWKWRQPAITQNGRGRSMAA